MSDNLQHIMMLVKLEIGNRIYIYISCTRKQETWQNLVDIEQITKHTCRKIKYAIIKLMSIGLYLARTINFTQLECIF